MSGEPIVPEKIKDLLSERKRLNIELSLSFQNQEKREKEKKTLEKDISYYEKSLLYNETKSNEDKAQIVFLLSSKAKKDCVHSNEGVCREGVFTTLEYSFGGDDPKINDLRRTVKRLGSRSVEDKNFLSTIKESLKRLNDEIKFGEINISSEKRKIEDNQKELCETIKSLFDEKCTHTSDASMCQNCFEEMLSYVENLL